MKELVKYKSKKVTSPFARLFLWAAGTDVQLLERCSYSDYVKQFCLGGIITATGVLAGLAGGYAFYMIFSQPRTIVNSGDVTTDGTALVLSIVFGFIWGMVILNLDRYIVSSTGKGDGTEKITRNEIKSAIPRIILGSIIAFTISKPLEVRLLQNEIDAELNKVQEDFKNDLIATKKSEYRLELSDLKDEMLLKNEEINKEDQNAKKLSQDYVDETTREDHRGIGEIAKGIEKRMKESLLKVDERRKELKLLQDRKTKIEAESRAIEENAESKATALDGMGERIKIAHNKFPYISWFLTLLFLALELTPIFFKLMVIRSPYDYMENNINRIIKAREGIEFRPEYYKVPEGMDEDGAGKVLDYTKYYVPDKLMEEQRLIIEKQNELIKEIIEKWSEREAGKIASSLDDYIDEGKA